MLFRRCRLCLRPTTLYGSSRELGMERRFSNSTHYYRVIHLVEHLGWVDLDFECSTVCPILLRLMGIWQKRARRWNTQIKINQIQPRSTSRWNTLYTTTPPLLAPSFLHPPPAFRERRRWRRLRRIALKAMMIGTVRWL